MTYAKPEEKKPVKPKYNMWRCTGFMLRTAWQAKEKKVIALCITQAVLAVAANLVSLYISPAVLAAIERGAPFAELALTVLAFVALIMLFAAAIAYVNTNTLYGRITVRAQLINAINRKQCITSYPNIFEEKFINLRSKASEATESNNASGEAVWTTLSDILKNLLGFAVYLILLSTLDLWLILTVIATTAVGYLVNKRLNDYEYRHRDERSQIGKRLWYNMLPERNNSAAKDIRIFNLAPWMDEITQKSLEALRAFQRRAENVYIWGKILDLALTFLRNGFAYIYLITLVLNGGLEVSEFLLYFSAIGGFTSWVNGILGNTMRLYRQCLDISTIRELLDYPEPFRFEGGAALPGFESGKYEIVLQDVSFKYPKADEYTLEHISLTLHPGEKLAVVGLNGAGKTTLIKLICGFLDPTEGRVLLDGTDIRRFNRREYYEKFSAVFQDFSLLAATVAANVSQSEDNIDMPRVKSCLDKAGLREKIESLPDGCESLLNRKVYENGSELSGGEMQRLMLARALYKDAPFVILDEPTAALDPIAEADIYAKYNEMTAGRSSVYISHRLASTRFCDRILLIEGRKIAEEGTHAQLLALGGSYAQLFGVQSKYYREGNFDEQ